MSRSETGSHSPSPKLHLVLGAFIVLGLDLAGPATAQSYTISDLASNGWSYSAAHGLNSTGMVVGEYEPATFFYVQAFRFDQGALSDLGHLSGAPYALAYGVNASGQVVGESDTAKTTHAFVFSNGALTDLGTLGTGNSNGYSSAHAINTAGQIVGESSISVAQVGSIHAVLFSNGAKTDLGALGGDYSSANALNNSGIVVGESDVLAQGATNVHAFAYANGAMTDLGTLGGGYSSAKGVNDSGAIVGEAETVMAGATNLHAFVYRNGIMSDLGTLGGASSSASAINTAGQIVGYATDTNEVSNAFLDDGSKMINLNSLLPPGSVFTNLSSADAINDSGQIAGSGYLVDGSYHAYLLTPAHSLTMAITNVAFDGLSFSCSFSTQPGVTYEGQFLTNLGTTNPWTTFTNFTGSGSGARITDSNPTGASRFYRVLAH